MDQTAAQGLDGYDSGEEREQQMISRTTDNSVPYPAGVAPAVTTSVIHSLLKKQFLSLLVPPALLSLQ